MGISAKAVDELIDSLYINGHELCDELERLVPASERVMSPDEAMDELLDAIEAGKVLPQNHPKRIMQLLERLIRGEIDFHAS